MTLFKSKKGNALSILVFILLAGIGIVSFKGINGLSTKAKEPLSKLYFPTKAQSKEPTHETSHFNWKFQKSAISALNGQLQVSLIDPSTTDYIVGVRTATDIKDTSLVVGDVTYQNPQSTSHRFISQIVDWPRDRIKLQPGSIEISGLSQATGSVLVYITIAPGTEVSVVTSGASDKTLAHATPANGLMIHNGVSLTQEVEGIRTLASRLTRPNPTVNTAKIVKIQGEQYVATPKGLAANLISLRKPTFPTGTMAEEMEQVLLRITIDEEGVIREINLIRGNKPFSDASVEAVREWKFRPFSADNKPISTKASVMFVFGKDGTISSPIFNELAK
ncbi:MAG: energy transducer TonB [Pyrinomonadaceae bacterium]